MMRVSDICLEKLKEFEGLRTKAYLDAAGVPTIGYGHTQGVRMGDVISEYWAEMFLKADLYDVEKQVDSLGHWNQPQFDALVSFAFNIGFWKRRSSCAGSGLAARSRKGSNDAGLGKRRGSLKRT